MKKIKWITLFLIFFTAINLNAQDELPPFYGVSSSLEMDVAKVELAELISQNGFDVVGSYAVGNNPNLWVIAFTNDDLKSVCSAFEDRGALASVLKLGLKKENGSVEISLLNPSYMFYAYFGADYSKHAKELNDLDEKVKNMVSEKYGSLTGFGGGLTPEKLEKYHYKVMMPYFEDPVDLQEYNSFEEGLQFIRSQIKKSGSDLDLVYEVVDENNQTAVFGIALLNVEMGEAHFLPIIGERHIAAMPYEIILQNAEASMLAGKYRFALYWPELSMGEFMKIMSTPGDVEDFMESLTVQE